MRNRLSILLALAATLGGVSPLGGQATPTSTRVQNRLDSAAKTVADAAKTVADFVAKVTSKGAADPESGYESAMKNDLRKLATAEEAYFSDHTAYYDGVVSTSKPLFGFSPSTNVTLRVTARTGGEPWIATATHALTPTKCTYELGKAFACDAGGPKAEAEIATKAKTEITAEAETEKTTRAAAAITTKAEPEKIPKAESEITIGSAEPVGMRPGESRSWEWAVGASKSRCLITGQVASVSGGDRNVVVRIMTEDDYQDWTKTRRARTYLESEPRREIPFDVRFDGAGRYRLVVTNPSSRGPSKIVQLQDIRVACTK